MNKKQTKTKTKPKNKTPIMMRVAFNFKRLRTERGWSVREAVDRFCKLTGRTIGDTHLRQLESGNTTFGQDNQEKWMKVYNVDISEFFKPPEETLDKDEMEILSLYRQVRNVGKNEAVAAKNFIINTFNSYFNLGIELNENGQNNTTIPEEKDRKMQ